jgi:hypothetical protein
MARRSALVLSLFTVLALAPSPARAGAADAYYADDTDGIFWYLHISDSHIGAITSGPYAEDHGAVAHLQWALGEAIAVIQPVFVAMTGDLTDASYGIIPTYGPQQDEWDTYKSIYTAAGMQPNFYYDIIGNHDLYGDQNGPHYLANSLQGQTVHSWHFGWTYTTPLGDYFFWGMNNIGTYMAPFTYGIGEVTDDEYNALNAAVAAHLDARLITVFAHQPLDRPANYERVRDLLGTVGAYHVHGDTHERHERLIGAVVDDECTSLGKGDETTGQDNDNFAVVAIDHDAFVYHSGSTTNPWPFVMITAPMSADLHDGASNPYAYQPCVHGTHNPVRALVLSKDPVTSVVAQVGFLAAQAMTPVPSKPGLYQAHFDTSVLPAAFHDVTVTASRGSTTVSHTIPVEFADCTPPLPQQDAGVEAGPSDAATGSDATVAQQDGPVVPPADGPAAPDPAGEDGPDASGENGGGGGGGCRAAGGGAGGALALALLGLVGALAVRRRC